MPYFYKKKLDCLLRISVATRERNALLFHNGRYNNRHDFVALEIIDGRVEFSFSLGTNITRVAAWPANGGDIGDGHWHDITVHYVNRVRHIYWLCMLKNWRQDINVASSAHACGIQNYAFNSARTAGFFCLFSKVSLPRRGSLYVFCECSVPRRIMRELLTNTCVVWTPIECGWSNL